MKIALLADIHANFAALRAFPETYWEDGHFHWKRYSYPFEETVTEIEAMPVSQAVQQQLSELITTGDLAVGKD
ncbi:MAG: hypothetical protein ACYDC6_12940 [Acidobacteriaceae bacterium]